MMNLSRTSLGAALLATVFVVGCEEPQLVGGEQRPPEMVYERVVALDPSSCELVARLAGSRRLVARAESCDHPNSVTNQPVAYFGDLELERIQEFEPDVVLYSEDQFTEEERTRLEELEASLFEYSPQTVEEYYDSVYELGRLLGREMEASGVVDDVYRTKQAGVNLDEQTDFSVLALEPSGDGWQGYGQESFVASLMEAAGGDYVDFAGAGTTSIDAQRIASLNPDMIFVLGDAESAVVLRQDARLAQVPAMQEQNVLTADPDVATRAGTRVEDVIDSINDAIQRTVNERERG
jgi:iron complex transport system substrate-binding protein